MTIQTFDKKYKGRCAIAYFEKISVNVRLLNAREKFGRLDVLVEPVAGSGHQWISDARIVFVG